MTSLSFCPKQSKTTNVQEKESFFLSKKEENTDDPIDLAFAPKVRNVIVDLNAGTEKLERCEVWEKSGGIRTVRPEEVLHLAVSVCAAQPRHFLCLKSH